MTPSCQFWPDITKTGWLWNFFTSLSISLKRDNSIVLLSVFDLSSPIAISYTFCGSLDINSSAPWEDFPTLPPALILGPSLKPKSKLFGEFSILQRSYNVLSPKLVLFFIICKPCFTIALFKPIRGTTSQTVPNETKSKRFKILGSEILFF